MRITVNTPHKKYSVIIESKSIEKYSFPKNAIVITNSTLQRDCRKRFKENQIVHFSAGEAVKRLATVEQLCEQLVKLNADRSSSIIAFGGGIVGDIAGFVASIYMRGIPVYQVPTTLLAMVDASVGGKTGVDLKAGKNLVGTFHQPEAVVIDPTVLLALPEEEFINGMGEVIKHGLLDKKLFVWLERNRDKIRQRDLPTLQRMLIMNVKIKQAVVEADEKEAGTRMLLNLGHTFGHAIEKLSAYSIPHGQAVAIGLIYAALYSKFPDLDRLIDLLHYFKLPSHLEKPFAPEQMIRAMQNDKKNRGNNITLVLPQALGEIHIHRTATASSIRSFLKQCARSAA